MNLSKTVVRCLEWLVFLLRKKKHTPPFWEILVTQKKTLSVGRSHYKISSTRTDFDSCNILNCWKSARWIKLVKNDTSPRHSQVVDWWKIRGSAPLDQQCSRLNSPWPFDMMDVGTRNHTHPEVRNHTNPKFLKNHRLGISFLQRNHLDVEVCISWQSFWEEIILRWKSQVYFVGRNYPTSICEYTCCSRIAPSKHKKKASNRRVRTSIRMDGHQKEWFRCFGEKFNVFLWLNPRQSWSFKSKPKHKIRHTHLLSAANLMGLGCYQKAVQTTHLDGCWI